MIRQISVLLILTSWISLYSQVPDPGECMLVTSGNMISAEYGVDISSQTVFFTTPRNLDVPFYVRTFDPDCGGAFDHSCGLWETNMVFEVYGGKGAISETDARQKDNAGNYRSGILLSRALFARESEVDGKWVSFGPFTAEMGEQVADHPGYTFFKVIIEGRTGDDRNCYHFFISREENSNIQIPNARLFEYRRLFLHGDSINIATADPGTMRGENVPIPLSLTAISDDTDYSIIAEPIEE